MDVSIRRKLLKGSGQSAGDELDWIQSVRQLPSLGKHADDLPQTLGWCFPSGTFFDRHRIEF